MSDYANQMAANWPSFLTSFGESVVFTAAGSSPETITAKVSFPKDDEAQDDTRESVRQQALVSFAVADVAAVAIDDVVEFGGEVWIVKAVDKGEGAAWRCTVDRRDTLRLVGRGRRL